MSGPLCLLRMRLEYEAENMDEQLGLSDEEFARLQELLDGADFSQPENNSSELHTLGRKALKNASTIKTKSDNPNPRNKRKR